MYVSTSSVLSTTSVAVVVTVQNDSSLSITSIISGSVVAFLDLLAFIFAVWFVKHKSKDVDTTTIVKNITDKKISVIFENDAIMDDNPPPYEIHRQ